MLSGSTRNRLSRHFFIFTRSSCVLAAILFNGLEMRNAEQRYGICWNGTCASWRTEIHRQIFHGRCTAERDLPKDYQLEHISEQNYPCLSRWRNTCGCQVVQPAKSLDAWGRHWLWPHLSWTLSSVLKKSTASCHWILLLQQYAII